LCAEESFACRSARQYSRPVHYRQLSKERVQRGAAQSTLSGLGMLLFLARMFFFVIAHHESITIGSTRLALSIAYTPLVVLALAWTVVARVRAFQQAPEEARGREFRRAVMDLWAFQFFAFDLTALVISDLGVALSTQFGALLFLSILAWRWVPPRMNGIAPYAMAIAPLLLLLVVQMRPTLALSSADPDRPRYEDQDWSANDLRLLVRGNAGAIRLIGQRRSEAVGIMQATMNAYTAGPLMGPGYFRGTVSDELKATATREHVPSVFIIGQWGIAGGVGFLLMLISILAPSSAQVSLAPKWATRSIVVAPLVVALALAAIAAAIPAAPPWGLSIVAVVGVVGGSIVAYRRTRGTLSPMELPPNLATVCADLFLFTLAFSGIYMLFANLGVLLFTGKNVYFFGLDSLGDLIEGLVLLAVAAWALSRRDEPPVTAGAV
jgi:hypothetical protein